MDRIRGLDTTPDRRFHAGDPATGQQATTVTAKWLNDVQEEAAAIVEDFGGEALKPDNPRQIAAILGAAVARAKREAKAEAIAQAKRESWPVGAIFISRTDSRNPATILGFGTWRATAQGRAIVGVGSNGESFYNAGATFGSERVQLSESQMPRIRFAIPATGDSGGARDGNLVRNDTGNNGPAETTSYTDYRGGDQSHENRPPSMAVHVWERIA